MILNALHPRILVVKGLNYLLKQEPWAQDKISQYSGKTISVQLGDRLKMALSFNHDGSVSEAASEIIPNVRVTLAQQHLHKLGRIIGSKQGVDELVDVLHIEGEAGLARVVSDLCRQLRWDKQHHLSLLIGPVLSSRVLKIEKEIQAQSKEKLQGMNELIQTHLHSEHTVLLNQDRFNEFCESTQQLDERLQKLERQFKMKQGY